MFKSMYLTSSVDQISRHVNGRGMSVVYTQTVEDLGHELRVFFHVLPEPRTVARSSAVTKFNAVTPNDHFSSDVALRIWSGKIK